MKDAFAFALESEAKQHAAAHNITEPIRRHVKESIYWLVADRGQPPPPGVVQVALMDELETLWLCEQIAKGLTVEVQERAATLASSIKRRHAEEIRQGEVQARRDEQLRRLGGRRLKPKKRN